MLALRTTLVRTSVVDRARAAAKQRGDETSGDEKRRGDTNRPLGRRRRSDPQLRLLRTDLEAAADESPQVSDRSRPVLRKKREGERGRVGRRRVYQVLIRGRFSAKNDEERGGVRRRHCLPGTTPASSAGKGQLRKQLLLTAMYSTQRLQRKDASQRCVLLPAGRAKQNSIAHSSWFLDGHGCGGYKLISGTYRATNSFWH